MVQFGHSRVELHKGNVSRPSLGSINLIFVKLGGDLRAYSKVMSVGGDHDVEARSHVIKKSKGMAIPTLSFSEEDKEGTCQPYDDALVGTIKN